MSNVRFGGLITAKLSLDKLGIFKQRIKKSTDTPVLMTNIAYLFKLTFKALRQRSGKRYFLKAIKIWVLYRHAEQIAMRVPFWILWRRKFMSKGLYFASDAKKIVIFP
jgi:hypothetical protein